VTDHSAKPKRLHTNSPSEDTEFYNYEQKLKEFHADSPEKTLDEKSGEFTHPAVKLLRKEFKLRNELKAEGGEDSEDDDEEEPESLIPQ